MRNVFDLPRAALFRICPKKTFGIIKITSFLLLVTFLNAFGKDPDLKHTRVNPDGKDLSRLVLAGNKETEVVVDLQQKRITGTVTDKAGAPFPGVNIIVTGTTQGDYYRY